MQGCRSPAPKEEGPEEQTGDPEEDRQAGVCLHRNI